MIHPKLMTDTDRLIKGFAVYMYDWLIVKV